uniref:Uncharacterized protein n=1 Tax=Cacopsylla melanoneura TaxID=428564 RepID=A0A8D8THJ3_9HEMI
MSLSLSPPKSCSRRSQQYFSISCVILCVQVLIIYTVNVPYLLCGSPMATYTKSMSHIYCVDLLSSIVCTRLLNIGLKVSDLNSVDYYYFFHLVVEMFLQLLISFRKVGLHCCQHHFFYII